MNPALENFLRGIGVVIAFAVLGFLADASNLSTLVSPQIAAIIAALAASGIAAFDAHKSPAGTVLMGTVGRAR